MKNKKANAKSRKGSVLDLLLIILLALCLTGLVMRRDDLASSVTQQSMTEYYVTVRVTSVHPMISDRIGEGDAFYTEQGDIYGTLIRREVRSASVSILRDGELFEGEWERDRLVDLTLTFSVSATEGKGVLLRGGKNAILCGQSIRLSTTLAEVNGMVLNYTPATEEMHGF